MTAPDPSLPDSSPPLLPAAGSLLPEVDPQPAIQRVKAVFSGLEQHLVGFAPLLIQSVYSLLTRENLLLFSPAGTAKTLFATLVFNRIGGARVFDTQMSKGTLAEELFGSIDTEQMKKGRLVHNTRESLVDSHLAFIDEFFDANDMVLRALLGIFHERMFKRGCQVEPAALHTGIAAANYLRATDVTEAVLDRFLFRAYIAPDYRPFTLLSIDQAFARHYGGCMPEEEVEQVSLAELRYLAEIVRGQHPQRRIHAAPHVLFMKNLVLNRYRELLDGAAEPAKRKLYVSPRTYAKSRIVLNAAALLRGRNEVAVEDIAQLKYAVTTVGGPEVQAQCFDKAFQEAVLRIHADDREHIDQLVAAQCLAEQVMARIRGGGPLPATTFLQRILQFFGLRSAGDLTFDHVRRFVDAVQPRDEQVKQLKQGLLERIQALSRRVDQRDHDVLNCDV